VRPERAGSARRAVPALVTAPGHDALADLIRKRIRDVPDYPQPGISFKDITPLLADGPLFAAVVEELAAGAGLVDKVAGIEARGFILAAPVAAAWYPGSSRSARPGSCLRPRTDRTTKLEYGTATIEVHTDAFDPGDGLHRGRRAGHRRDRAGHRRSRAALPVRRSSAWPSCLSCPS